MIRRATFLSFALALAAGTALFVVKHEVQKLEEELGRISRATLGDQEAVHVLKAEWSYLNEPSRLQRLAEKHLSLKPLTAQRLVDLDTLPWEHEPALAANRGGEKGAPEGQRQATTAPFPPDLPIGRTRQLAAAHATAPASASASASGGRP